MIDKSLEYARKKADMTQKELAEKTGITRSKIAMVEAGERELSVSDIRKISSVLGIAPCFLLSVNPAEDFKCDDNDLCFSAPTIDAIRNMSEKIRVAFEYLINDPTFGLAIASYFFPEENEGIYRNGNPVAKANDEVIIGSIEQYGASWNVDDLYEFVMERDIQATLLNIRRRIRR